MTLKELQIGKSAVIKSVGSHGALRQHFLDMGMIPGVETGAQVMVPLFVNEGDTLKIDTRTGEYSSRV